MFTNTNELMHETTHKQNGSRERSYYLYKSIEDNDTSQK